LLKEQRELHERNMKQKKEMEGLRTKNYTEQQEKDRLANQLRQAENSL
jgi:hypothetical protein